MGGDGGGGEEAITAGVYAGRDNGTVKALSQHNPQGPLLTQPHPNAHENRRPAVHAHQHDQGVVEAAATGAGGGETGVYAGAENWTVKALSHYSSTDDDNSHGRSPRAGLSLPQGWFLSDTEDVCGVGREGGRRCTPRGALGTIPESVSVCSDTSSSSLEEEEMEERGSFTRPSPWPDACGQRSAGMYVDGLNGSMDMYGAVWPTDPTLQPNDQDTLHASVDRLFCEALSSLDIHKRLHLTSKEERKRLALNVRRPFIPPGCA